MSEFLERISKLSPKRLALLAVELQSKLDLLERRHSEPIAVIGIGCRFPGGANGPDSFWQNLLAGRDAVTEVPPERWDVNAFFDPDPDACGKMNTRWGGFLQGIDQFDPEFFGITPREATGMDPQQRLLLEVAWEALEHAGQSPEHLAGSRTGVFVGLCNSDYYLMRAGGGLGSIDAYVATGNAHSVASGRISYLLGLQGPSLSVDTACSSSLVAVHLACQSLRTNECRMALAGGVNLILGPDTTVTLSKARMMSPAGRCKAFDAAADGFVRSEGCGLVVLKRLSDARADGDGILAVVRGSACNQDGRSSGLTAPNGPSQISVIRDALADAALKPNDIDYIEAHGTGTALGDPIEARALAEVFAPGRDPRRPLLVGSVKTNIGHAESAAGIAGLIKAVLALHAGVIPPSLHFKRLNPKIEWSGLGIGVPTNETPWNHPGGPHAVGVSSFGFSGTNAHVILSTPPEAEPASTRPVREVPSEPSHHVLPLSGRTEKALAAMAGCYERMLESKPESNWADLCFSASVTRSHFEHRLALSASSAAEAREALAKLRLGTMAPSARRGRAPASTARGVVFMFTGQGAQYPRMGRELFNTQPVFRRELERCAEVLRPHLEKPLLEVLFAEVPRSAERLSSTQVLDETQYTQPAIFAIEYALAAMWRSWGVEPAAVLGHSVGEYAAACVAGVFSLEEGLRLIAERGRLSGSLAPGGTMAAVFADEARLAQALASAPSDRVAIACINGPGNTVVSGDREAVERLLARLAAEGVSSRLLRVSHAFHSPLVEPILHKFESIAQSVRSSEPRVAIVSNLTGQPASRGLMTSPAYWVRHLRQPVRFADSIRCMTGMGMNVFLEIGPHPVLTAMATGGAPEGKTVWASSLNRERDDWESLCEGLSMLYTAGVAIDWAGVHAEQPRKRVSLPTYPFQRSRFWLEGAGATLKSPVITPHSTAVGGHPLVGRRLDSPALAGAVFELEMGTDRPGFLDDHRIFGRIIMPSPAYIEMALAGAADLSGIVADQSACCEVSNLTIREPLILPDEGRRRIQTIFDASTPQGTEFRVCSRESHDGARSSAEGAWRTHATGRVLLGDCAGAGLGAPWNRAEVWERCPEEVEAATFYESLIALGLKFGERFRGLVRIRRGRGEALAEVRLPTVLEPETKGYRIHPALLDSCFHLLGAALPGEAPRNAYLLIGLDRFSLYSPPPTKLWNHTVLRPVSGSSWEAFAGDIRLYDEEGRTVAEARGLQLRRATGAAMAQAAEPDFSEWFYELQWRPQDTVSPESSAPDFIPAVESLAKEVQPQLRLLAAKENLEIYNEVVPKLESLSGAFVVRALLRLGWPARLHQHVEAAELARKLGILPAHLRLFARLMQVLTEDRFLRADGQGWRVERELESSSSDLRGEVATLRERYPACSAELTLLARCGERLDEVLRGACDPLQLLFPSGDFETSDALYRRSPFARVLNNGLCQAVSAALDAAPLARMVQVLEIGAGTGGTTSFLLPRLTQRSISYTFSDLSPLFLARAQREFRDFPFARFELLDIEKAPATQGFAGRSFDIIIAANVLHATRDLRETLGNVEGLLAPGGLLVLLEGLARQRWVDLTFGLTEGWWRFEDLGLRPDYALVSSGQWRHLLNEKGFESVAVSASANDTDPAAQQVLLLAKKPSTARVHAPPEPQGYWIVLSDSGGVGDALVSVLEQSGARCLSVARGSAYTFTKQGPITLDPRNPGDVTRLLCDAAAHSAGPLLGIVNLWPVTERADADTTPAEWEAAQERLGAGVLNVMRAFLSAPSAPHGVSPRLWLVTRNAQAASLTDGSPQPIQAMVWGLARVISLEHPARFGAVIDLDPESPPGESAALIAREIENFGNEDAVAFRRSKRWVPRIARVEIPPEDNPITFRRDGTYLVTGGLGGLGLRITEWLARGGAGHIVLVSRRDFPDRCLWSTITASDSNYPAVQTLLGAERAGATVALARGDVADPTFMEPLFEQFGGNQPSLRGVVHAAVDMTGRPIEELDVQAFSAMCRAKALGGWVLHKLTRRLELDFFVLFSSTTSWWGAAGLGHYAAANQALDLLAHYRRASGLPALSVNFGTWQDMRVASEADKRRFVEAGLRPMDAQRALAALQRLIRANRASASIASVDWDALRSVYEARRPRPIFAEMRNRPDVETIRSRTEAAASDPPKVARQLHDAPAARRREILVAHLRAQAAGVLGFDATREIELDQGLFDMGMDSLMSVDLKGRLEKSLGVQLPSTLMFNYPSIGALADYLLREVLVRESSPSSAPSIPVVTASVAPGSSDETSDEELSEEELSRRILEKLERKR